MELFLVAAALLVGTLAVMWVQRPPPVCTLAYEPPQRLVLSQEIDRERLATQYAMAKRIAQRYKLSIADSGQREARFVECEAALVQQIAARYGLSSDRARIGQTDARQQKTR